MKILALETSGISATIALEEDGATRDYLALPDDARSAQTLAPGVVEILKRAEWKPDEIDVVAVSVGPGSFTGLRVGLATAKTFAWAIGAKIVGVDAFDAAAYEIDPKKLADGVLSEERRFILSIGIDAQRGDAVVKNYFFSDDQCGGRALDERFRLVSIAQWLSMAEEIEREYGAPVCYIGSALRRVRNPETALAKLNAAPSALWEPTAAGIARAARSRAETGEYDDVWSILPIYSRLAAAEERAAEKAAQKRA